MPCGRSSGLGRLVLAAALGAAAILALAAGGPALEPWEQVLAQQLGTEQKCIMTSTYNVHRIPLGQDTVLGGKARCYDGREFDFSQKKNHLKFELRACEPTVC